MHNISEEPKHTDVSTADLDIQWDMTWKLVDWSGRSKMDLPWHRDRDMLLSARRPDAAARDKCASEDAENETKIKRIESKLPWLHGARIDWSINGRREAWNISKRLLAYSHYANMFDDLNTVIELMLTEARDATRADGGTFYLVTQDEQRLKMAFFQNDTLSNGRSESRNHYVNVEIPISETSISGFVALSKQLLNIPNVAELPEGVPFSFNRSFDESSGYDTVSMLTVPVIGVGGKVMAVLQLINSLDEHGAPKAFDETEVLYAEMLAFQSIPYLTKSIMARRLIETMLRISEMRDPLETGAHVARVGSFTAEIYQRWAERNGVPRDEMVAEKDTLRLAAMLHDIGKLLIPDAIIKKPGKLTDDEYELMKTHCALGAKMYADAETALEAVAHDITLYHHQRWDGHGYTGDPNVPNLEGSAIPLYARITSVADVLDALAFSRSYKEAWKFEDALAEIERGSGTQFDPEVVAAALDIPDTLKAIVDSCK